MIYYNMDISPITAYSLRIDVSHNLLEDQKYLETFYRFLDEHTILKYMFAKEKKEDGTEHLQGIILPIGMDPEVTNTEAWDNCAYEDSELNLMRSQIRLKLVGPNRVGQKGSYSFVKSKKPASLFKYCNDKEGLGVLTNFTDEERTRYGKWDDKEVKKKTLKEELEEYIQDVGDAVSIGEMSRTKFVDEIVDAYVKTYGNLPRATQVEKWLYLYGSNTVEKQRMRRDKYSHIYSGITQSKEYDEHNNNYYEEHGVTDFFEQ